MIHNLKPYPAYKDSGVLWMGEVPENWEVVRCGRLFREIVDTGHPDAELLSIDRFRGIIRQSETGRKERASEDRSSYKKVLPGELAYNLMNAFMGSIGFSTLEGVISPAYAVARPLREIEPAYFHYLFRTQLFTTQFDRYSYGIMYERNRLYFERFKTIPTIVPSITEQSAIVCYLDHIDRRIRRYIRAKQKLIKLLEEQKQAIIHQTVTHGLDPNVKLKSSGVEWLGKVPENWDINAVKRRYAIQLGKMLQGKKTGTRDELVQYLKAQHVQWFAVSTSDLPFMWASPEDIEQFSIKTGDLLVCEGGEGGRCGLVGQIQGCYIIQNALHRVRPLDFCLNDYLQYVMNTAAATGWFTAINNKATIAHFTREKFGSLKVPIPTVAEQHSIVRFLDKETADLNHAIDLAKYEISLLREYRTRLIADVVTGKLGVREVAANLPEETDEPEVLEDEIAGDEETTEEELECESEDE